MLHQGPYLGQRIYIYSERRCLGKGDAAGNMWPDIKNIKEII